MLLSVRTLSRMSVVLFTTAACTASPSPAARADSATPVTDQQASFTRIRTQTTSGFDEPAELAIRDQGTLESAWARLFNQVQGNPAPTVDFAHDMVILVALGGRSSGGFTVRVDAITRSGDGAVVRYTATRPGPDCMTTQSQTSPVEVVRAPRVAGTVRFERRDVVQPC